MEKGRGRTMLIARRRRCEENNVNVEKLFKLKGFNFIMFTNVRIKVTRILYPKLENHGSTSDNRPVTPKMLASGKETKESVERTLKERIRIFKRVDS